jgi:hypothetical protein
MDNGIICDLSKDVVSIQTNKQYGRMSGAFHLTVTFARTRDGERYDEILDANDIITIELAAGDGDDLRFVLVGVIDRIAETQNFIHEGIPKRTIIITGQDFGKFLQTQLGWDYSGVRKLMNYGTAEQDWFAAYIARYENSRGSAKQLTEWLFNIFKTQIPDAFYPQYLDLKIDTDDVWVTYDPQMVGLRGTTAWDAMQRLSNRPYNMLTTQTESDGKFYVVLEKNPIGTDGKMDRPTMSIISSKDIVNRNLGFSDHERVNLLCLWPPNYKNIMNRVLEIALAHKECTRFAEVSVKTHGFCPLVIETDYVPLQFILSEDENPMLLEETIKRRDLFWAWYSMNHTYEAGSLVVHGRPDIVPGAGVVHKEAQKQYMVEGVMHNYSVAPVPSFMTTLHVTRGQKN